MQRRDFLALLPASAAAQKGKDKKKAAEPAPPPPPEELVKSFFLDIVRGHLANAARTSPTLAVVEYPNATVTRNFLAKSGLSATGVTRMLPALAAWCAGKRAPDSGALDALIRAFRHGTDPAGPDYWLPSPEQAQNQRQVESSIVAWSLWTAREQILPALSGQERKNVAAWLASCTKVPVRNNNWAWFTAVNLAVRARLSEQYPEFEFDEPFMLADLRALDAMATGDSGWYNDGLKGHAYDYYNSWVFASHFLYWNALVGARYPEWQKRFTDRLSRYLETAPYFFANHGGHVLYGRSLIYRWAVLTPLVLAYRQKLWPHSPGLLRRIVGRNILWQSALGALDAQAGKLRESYTPQGATDIRESYIDGGHPYWGMQAFSFWEIPDGDPFWTAPEESMPVEKSDYAIALPEAGLLLTGVRASGHVRVFNALSTRADTHYRDKYDKLVYSSHFPFAVNHDKEHPTLDNLLAIRNTATGQTAIRGEVSNPSVEAEKIELDYSITLGAVTAKVHTEIRFRGDFESRQHLVEVSGGPLENLELVEGGAPYSPTPVALNPQAMAPFYKEVHLKTWNLRGWKSSRTEDRKGSVFYGDHKLHVLSAPLAPLMNVASIRYASPKAMPKEKVDAEAQALASTLRP
jgi:hypothetical protein